jgi:hypothetical protein
MDQQVPCFLSAFFLQKKIIKVQAASQQYGNQMNIEKGKEQGIIDDGLQREIAADDQADATNQQYTDAVIPAEKRIFEKEIIAEGDQYFYDYREGRIKQDQKDDRAGNCPLDHLHPGYLVGEPANDPEYAVPAGGMTFIPGMGQQIAVAVAAFGDVPGMRFITP